MHYKNNYILAACFMACFLLTPTVSTEATAKSPQKPPVTLEHKNIGNNISVIMGVNGFTGGNVAVLSGTDGQLVVDDMLPDFQSKLSSILKTLNKCADCKGLKYLINTHWHFDHTGNNEHFGDATLIAHETVRALLANDQELKAFNMKVPAQKPAGLPDISFAKKAYVYFNDEEIELAHFPKSHTTGDIVVYFKNAKILHMGDLFFNGMFPFIDVEHGGNVKGLIKSVGLILENYPADIQIIPGHGPLASMKDLRLFLEMLQATTQEVDKAKAAGMDLADIQKQGLNNKWKSWSSGVVDTKTWISLIFNSL